MTSLFAHVSATRRDILTTGHSVNSPLAEIIEQPPKFVYDDFMVLQAANHMRTYADAVRDKCQLLTRKESDCPRLFLIRIYSAGHESENWRGKDTLTGSCRATKSTRKMTLALDVSPSYFFKSATNAVEFLRLPPYLNRLAACACDSQPRRLRLYSGELLSNQFDFLCFIQLRIKYVQSNFCACRSAQ